MKKIIFKTLSILAVGFLIAGTSVAQEKHKETHKEEIKKESKFTIKIVKDGKTVIDSTFESSEGIDHEKIHKLIKKFSGEDVYVNLLEASGDHVFEILEGGDSKTMKMKFFSDEDFEFFGEGEFEVIRKDSKNGETVIRIDSKYHKEKDKIKLKSIGYGVYRLEFNSEELDPILIEVFNSEGKRLFKKKVKNFYGRFIKEIELEDNEISFFSVIVVQGDKEIIGEFEFK